MGNKAENRKRLRDVKWQRFLHGPDAELLENLYIPALSRAVRYDRCCAYFSSHVLAVAARGFGGFIQNLLNLGDTAPKPAARLVVNEELDPADLKALLSTGDQKPLIEKLLAQFKTPREALEKNRLAMLAWLVTSGFLEVRVGLMRHTQGVLHAKFGLITDLNGDCVAFMGSDNETAQAIVENYEQVTLGTSWDDPEFVNHYRDHFEALWEDRDEYVTTLPLPEAVKREIIKLAPLAPPEELAYDQRDATAAMIWHFIAAAPYLPNGEYACDATAMVDLWPHQRPVVEDVSRAFPAGRLLCDEVGMGKTIEATMALRRLLSGRGVKRALLLVPKGLLQQWQDELREKGGLLISYWDRGYLTYPDGHKQNMLPDEALRRCDVLLLSREWARLPGNRDILLNAPAWDLVLLDEAHAARRSSSVEREFNSANLLLELLRYMQLRRRTRGILLLSATPMQTQPWEPWDLLTVLGIGGRWMVEFTNIRTYYNGIAALRNNTLPWSTAMAIGQLVANDDEFPPPPIQISTNTPQNVADSLTFYAFNAREQLAEWLRRGAPLGRRMHRNSRDTLRQYHEMGLLPLPPPSRDVQDVVFDYEDPAERKCYEAITDYIDRRYDELEKEKAGKGFVMTVYRRRAASSPLALRRSLERRMERLDRVIHKQWWETWVEAEEEQVDPRDLADADMDEKLDPAVPSNPEVAAAEKSEIQSLLEKLIALGSTDSKLAKFWNLLRELTSSGRSVLVFTEYVDTMEYLRDQLRPAYGETLGCFSGAGGAVWNGKEWVPVSKGEIAERLSNGKLKILVCTDAASEGLNLQAASVLINYDLPWNPSKVEQRIGRIDRIGQQERMLPIRNLFLADSVDMRVYEVLRQRCGLFKHFVGHMQPVLAMARNALKANLRPEQTPALLQQLEKTAQNVESDSSVVNAFVESPAQADRGVVPIVTCQDMEAALALLSNAKGTVKATRLRGSNVWRLSGISRESVKVTTDCKTLERDPLVYPLTLGSDILDRLLNKLPLSTRMPLVIAEYSTGAFRCAEARWVQPRSITRVESLAQLKGLVEMWDGTPPPSTLRMQAEKEARDTAKQRVLDMKRQAEAVEEAALRRQVMAARRRLMLELGRTLRCMDDGSLNDIFRTLVQREQGMNDRYHTALRLLDGYPQWTPEDIADIDAFVSSLKPKDKKARIAGSEIDAAINDPRWMAKTALEEKVNG